MHEITSDFIKSLITHNITVYTKLHPAVYGSLLNT